MAARAATMLVCKGVLPLGCGRGVVRVSFPANLDAEGKFAAATALAKVVQQLVAEADASLAEGPDDLKLIRMGGESPEATADTERGA